MRTFQAIQSANWYAMFIVESSMPSLPPQNPSNKAQNRPRKFRGIRIPKEYENTIQESVEQDIRDPEDQNQPEIPNEIRKYGGGFNG